MIGFWIVLVSVFSNLCFLFDEILQMFKNQNDKKIHMNSALLLCANIPIAIMYYSILIIFNL